MTERERFDAYWLARQRARGFGDRLTDAEMLAYPDRRKDEFHAWVAARADSTEAQAEITDDQIVSAIQDAGFNLAFRNFEDDLKLARAILALRAPRQALEQAEPSFAEAWVAKGYQYSDSNVAKVRLGWDMAIAALTRKADSAVIADVIAERKRQDEQWGGPAHDDLHDAGDWGAYIRHQLKRLVGVNYAESFARERFIKIAALGMAAAESLTRKADKGDGNA
jgi:hypothetical protein